MNDENPLGFDVTNPGFGFTKDENGNWVFNRNIIE